MKLMKNLIVLLLTAAIVFWGSDALAAKKKKSSSGDNTAQSSSPKKKTKKKSGKSSSGKKGKKSGAKYHVPKKVKEKAKNYTIALDAGHGDDTPGKRSCPYDQEVTHSFNGKTVTVHPGEQYKEHYANVGIANELCKILEAHGFKVFKSGWNDDNPADDVDSHEFQRRDKIRAAGSTITISIHHNASGDGWHWHGGIGLETYYWTGQEQSRILANHIHNQLIAIYNPVNRGVKENQFWMTDNGAMGTKASILIEHNFMTNRDETYAWFSNPEAWFNYATASARGLCNFLNIEYHGPKPTSQASEPAVPGERANF